MDPNSQELQAMGTLNDFFTWVGIDQPLRAAIDVAFGTVTLVRQVVFIPRTAWDAAVVELRVHSYPLLSPMDLQMRQVRQHLLPSRPHRDPIRWSSWARLRASGECAVYGWGCRPQTPRNRRPRRRGVFLLLYNRRRSREDQ